MTTLAASAARTYYQGDFHDYPVIAADIIYGGAAVGDNGSGYARPLQAGDPFRGFAELTADNSAGAAGDIYVRSRTRGDIQLAIGSLAITDVGKDVYASDDNTFTLTASTNTRIGHVHAFVESGVGVVRFSSTTGVQTELTDSTGGSANTTLAALGGITTLTDSTGLSGTHDDTLAAVSVPADLTGGESPTEAEHNALLAVIRVMAQNQSDVAQKVIELVTDMATAKNNFADLAASVNTLIRRLGN